MAARASSSSRGRVRTVRLRCQVTSLPNAREKMSDVAPCMRGAGLLPSRTATMARTTRSTEKAVSAGERSVASAMRRMTPEETSSAAAAWRQGGGLPRCATAVDVRSHGKEVAIDVAQGEPTGSLGTSRASWTQAPVVESTQCSLVMARARPVTTRPTGTEEERARTQPRRA